MAVSTLTAKSISSHVDFGQGQSQGICQHLASARLVFGNSKRLQIHKSVPIALQASYYPNVFLLEIFFGSLDLPPAALGYPYIRCPDSLGCILNEMRVALYQ